MRTFRSFGVDVSCARGGTKNYGNIDKVEKVTPYTMKKKRKKMKITAALVVDESLVQNKIIYKKGFYL